MRLLLLSSVLILLVVERIYAQWPAIPDPNVAVTSQAATTDAKNFWAAPDGVGGSYAIWEDDRVNPANSGIYCQRMTNIGVVKFVANGIKISDVPGSKQKRPTAAPGTNSSALIVWEDERNSGTTLDDIYAKAIDSVGVTLWGGGDGLLICNATDKQERPQIVSDGAGGAIIAWRDKRNNAVTGRDIYAQRINSSGTAQWISNGVAITTATGDQSGFHLIADGAGGAIIAWEDLRSGISDIYIQKINASGVVQWTADGVAISTATDNQKRPQIVTDGAGGAIIAWEDSRSGTEDIYSQRIISAGTVSWTANGVLLCGATNIQKRPTIVTDQVGGALIAWEDLRTGGIEDIYIHRISSAGVPYTTGAWVADGIVVSAATNIQKRVHASSTDVGAALIAWEDLRSGTAEDIYIEAVMPDGSFLTGVADGLQITSNVNIQARPFIFQNNSSEWIVLWEDDRNNPGVNNDVYAQGINNSVVPAFGNSLPVELIYFNAESGFTEVKLQWATASELNNDYFEIEKSRDGYSFHKIGEIDGIGTTEIRNDYFFTDHTPFNGIQYYRLKQFDHDGTFEYSNISSASYIGNTHLNIYPNPVSGNYITISYSGDPASLQSIYIADFNGKIIAEQEFEIINNGWKVTLNLPKGVYIMILQTTERTYREKIIKL